MPKYFCEYCDTYLTHDSPSVRKTHNNGRKHKENVRIYYQKWMEEQAQNLIDATTAAFKAGKIANNPFQPGVPGSGPPPPGTGGAMIPPPANLQPPPPGPGVRPPMPAPMPGPMPGMPMMGGQPMMGMRPMGAPMMMPGMPGMMRPPLLQK